MSVLYADASVLVRAYVAGEPEHEAQRDLLLAGDQEVVTSEIARIELASAVQAAVRAGRIRRAEVLLRRFDSDCADGGPIALLALDREVVLQAAYDLVLRFRLRTLDAVHLAVATGDPAIAGDVVLVTRDADQAAAARTLGLATL